MSSTKQQTNNTKCELKVINGHKCNPEYESGYPGYVSTENSLNTLIKKKPTWFEERRKARKKEKAVLMVFDSGIICDCNQAAGELLDYFPEELTGQHISKVFPQLFEIQLVQMQRVNPYLRSLSRDGHRFDIVDKSGKQFTCELFFRDMINLGLYNLSVTIYPV